MIGKRRLAMAICGLAGILIQSGLPSGVKAYAQDGISPDTVYIYNGGVGTLWKRTGATFPARYMGEYRFAYGDCDSASYLCDSIATDVIQACNTDDGWPTYERISRGFTLFNTVGLLSLDTCIIENCKFITRLQEVKRDNGDSLWVVQFLPRYSSKDAPGCLRDESHPTDSCNYYMCGNHLTFQGQRGTNFYAGADTGWVSIPFPTGYFQTEDTTGLGLVTQPCFPFDGGCVGDNPSDTNSFKSYTFASQGINLAYIVYEWIAKEEQVTHRAANPWGRNPWGRRPWGR